LFRKLHVVLSLAALALVWLALGCGTGSQAGVARGVELFEDLRALSREGRRGQPGPAQPPIAGLPDWYVRRAAHEVQERHPRRASGPTPKDIACGRWPARSGARAT